MRAATMARAATLGRSASYGRRPRCGSGSPVPPDDGAQPASRPAAAAAADPTPATAAAPGPDLISPAEPAQAPAAPPEAAVAWRTNPASKPSPKPSPSLHPAGGAAAPAAHHAHDHDPGALAHVLFSDGPGRSVFARDAAHLPGSVADAAAHGDLEHGSSAVSARAAAAAIAVANASAEQAGGHAGTGSPRTAGPDLLSREEVLLLLVVCVQCRPLGARL